MKKHGLSILILITCMFAAFTLGIFIGRNQNHNTVEVSMTDTASPTTSVKESSAPSTNPTQTTSANTGRININTATHSELMTLPGIGEVIAQRIIDYRTEHGNFRCVEDLLNVSGIGEKRLEAILDYVTVGG